MTLRVTKAWTGIDAAAKEIEIETGLGGGDCGYAFERGTEYIVYAYGQPNRRLSTGICSPTRPVENAAEDLKYLRSLHEREPVSEIRVTAFDPQQSLRAGPPFEPAGLEGAHVAIQGNEIHKTAKTDGGGRAVFSNLPPGEYNVTVNLDGYMLSNPLRPVKVQAKGCAEVPAALTLDRVVSGQVRTRDGVPAAGVTVEAVQARPRNSTDIPSATDSAVTDASGRYELRHLRTGSYYLGVSLSHSPTAENPYTRWFYPGTEDPRAAVHLQVGDRPERQSFDITLPPRQNERVIEGVVAWPDGRLVPGANILLEDPRWPWQVGSVAATSRPDGSFTAKAMDGTKYRVHAVLHGPDKRVSAEPVTVEPGSGTAKVTLLLTRTGFNAAEEGRKALESWRKGLGLQ